MKLTDGNQEYKTNIPTAGLSKDELKEWQKGLTGQEFLEQNLNYKALKQNPDLNLNVTNETDRELQPVNELTQDNKKEITSPKR